MRTNIKTAIVLTVAITSSVLFTSCTSADKAESTTETTAINAAGTTDADAHSGTHTYACPMHPEVTGKEGDMCPKCGMKLEHNDNAGKSNGKAYVMNVKTTPATIEAGKAGLFSFTPGVKDKEGELVPLDLHHERKIHLIVVSKDLSYFEHIHPDYQASGTYDLAVLPANKAYTAGANKNETHFAKGGEYILFADYTPTGGTPQLEKINLTVGGTPYKPVTYSSPKLSSTVDNYTLELVPEGNQFEVGKLAHIEGVLKKDGKVMDAATLENYLGAKAHMVVVGIDDKNYLHVHPEVVNGKFDLHTTFEKAGIYRGWVQFQDGGKIRTMDYVIAVK
ncbi:heavy metal-binding domain-containing protein [Spirosoma luteum]|uniref:heavy metal-binding domain-containing protein n=1 Tax=Spirosoma luteum TaxID=431553 RepID=UPI000364577B|nr:heavy metal-binding domain-containing protein [Spirosoma luteum]